MTQGELVKLSFALYKIAEVEDDIDHVEIWDNLGEEGLENVYKLQSAINILSNVIADGTINTRKSSNKD